MRIERWYWLIGFIVISFGIHVGLVCKSRSFGMVVPPPRAQEMEVALEPLKEPVAPPKPEPKKPEPEKKPEPKKSPPTQIKPYRTPTRVASPKPSPKPIQVARNDHRPESPKQTKVSEPVAENRPLAPNADPGGFDPTKDEKPIAFGLPIGRKDAGAPQMQRTARVDKISGGGGSPAPGPVLGGKGGAPGPEAPIEDILYNGGGAGGEKLPHVAPRMGGGGGNSIMSVENPLAKDAVPEEKPGGGPGLGGGQGAGACGGVGFARQRGIGTRLDGKVALGTLQSKPGDGIGAGQGHGIGTRPPGGGKGTGSELPGTGGTGLGYGRGSGFGVGNGKGTGVGDGDGGNRVGLTRGVPFGDITGLLRGDPNGGGGRGGGPGGSGRGAVFGAKPKSGSEPVHIVYLLDVSGSMRDGNKIGKAKEALKKAISELKSGDSFDIVAFDRHTHPFATYMLPVTPGNVEAAMQYVDDIDIGPGTNLSGALQIAFDMEEATHIFVLSDGEPTAGERDPDKIRRMVKELNSKKVQVLTLALGLGEHFPGMALLQGLADDNRDKDGKAAYSYVNLAKIPDKDGEN